MKRTMRYFILTLLLLQSCVLLKKKVNREQHQEATEQKSKSTIQFEQRKEAETTQKTARLTAELKQDETVTHTVKEVYDTTGHIEERTTTTTRAKTHKESTRQATTDLKQGIEQSDSTIERVAQTRQKQQKSEAVGKDIKRSGLPLWLWSALVASLGFVVWKKSALKRFLNAAKALFKR